MIEQTAMGNHASPSNDSVSCAWLFLWLCLRLRPRICSMVVNEIPLERTMRFRKDAQPRNSVQLCQGNQRFSTTIVSTGGPTGSFFQGECTACGSSDGLVGECLRVGFTFATQFIPNTSMAFTTFVSSCHLITLVLGHNKPSKTHSPSLSYGSLVHTLMHASSCFYLRQPSSTPANTAHYSSAAALLRLRAGVRITLTVSFTTM